MNQLTDPTSIINAGGVLGVLALIVYLALKRKWHTDGEFKDMQAIYLERIKEIKEDRDYWKGAALKSIDTNESQAVHVAKLTGIVEEVTRRAASESV